MPNATKPIPELSEKDKERFWSKVSKGGPLPDQFNPHYSGLDRCWNWLAGVAGSGYGVFTVNRKAFSSHRIAYFIERGDIPLGMFVLHRCDNRRCCNPTHAFLGKNSENTSDMYIKGRGSFTGSDFLTAHPELKLRGSAQPRSKLTEVIVTEMRRRAATKESGASLARAFGVTKEAANSAICGDTWAHLPDAIPKGSRQYITSNKN